jgi:hypothetical protein
MVKWIRSVERLRPAALAAALVLAAGCAASPPTQSGAQPSSSAASSQPATAAAAAPASYQDETPMSDTRLVSSAQFATNAEQHGFKPEVRNGQTVYCWADKDIGSLIPTKKCVDRTQLDIMLQQRQHQRDQMNQGSFGCTPGTPSCGH